MTTGMVMSGMVMSGMVMSGMVMSGMVMSGMVMSGMVTTGAVTTGTGAFREMGEETLEDGRRCRAQELEERLADVERIGADIRKRQLRAELRSDPARLLSGVAGARRVLREDLDELCDILSRWERPLSAEDLAALRQASLVARAVSGAQDAQIHLVVDVAIRASEEDLHQVLARARVLSERSRRAVPVIVSLEGPMPAVARRAGELVVELVVDG